jgi:type VI secretion system secreted protein VgrG
MSRLLEGEGITHFFEHQPEGHLWVLTDDTTHKAFCPELPIYDVISYNAGDRVI